MRSAAEAAHALVPPLSTTTLEAPFTAPSLHCNPPAPRHDDAASPPPPVSKHELKTTSSRAVCVAHVPPSATRTNESVLVAGAHSNAPEKGVVVAVVVGEVEVGEVVGVLVPVTVPVVLVVGVEVAVCVPVVVTLEVAVVVAVVVVGVVVCDVVWLVDAVEVPVAVAVEVTVDVRVLVCDDVACSQTRMPRLRPAASPLDGREGKAKRVQSARAQLYCVQLRDPVEAQQSAVACMQLRHTHTHTPRAAKKQARHNASN